MSSTSSSGKQRIVVVVAGAAELQTGFAAIR
jgi:hypothetical protein